MSRLRSLLLYLLLAFAVPALAETASLEDAERLFVGLTVNDREVDPVDVYRQAGSYWLPLELVLEAVGIRLLDDGQSLRLISPLGHRSLSRQYFPRWRQQRFISDRDLQQFFRIQARFNAQLYSLALDVPWQPGQSLLRYSALIEPDVMAPQSSVSLIRWQSRYSQNLDANLYDYTNTLDLAGGAGTGVWLLGLESRPQQDARLERYFWSGESDNTAYRLGTSYVNLNPLLAGVRFTGGQGAWSSEPIARLTDFSRNLNADSFLASDVQSQEVISRTGGPPAGIAELRINDRSVQRVRIDLNGFYQFSAVPASVGSFQRTEIYLYERSVQEKPVAIIDNTRSLVREMLAEGETLVRSGGGEVGNGLYEEGVDDGAAVSFLQLRHGLTRNATVQAIFQQSPDQPGAGVLGLRSSLGAHWAWAADAGINAGEWVGSSELSGVGDGWNASLRSRYLAANYFPSNDSSYYDHSLQANTLLGRTLRAGLVGRFARDTDGAATRFIKPSFYWGPSPRFSLSGTPGYDGDYRYVASYRPHRQHHITASHNHNLYSLTHDYRAARDANLLTGYEYDTQTQSGLVFMQADWHLRQGDYSDQNNNHRLQVGVSYNGESSGYQLSWNRKVSPGVELQAGYRQGYQSAEDSVDPAAMVYFNVRLDFAVVRGRLRSASHQDMNFARGGISGSLVGPEGERLSLDGAGISINGHRLNRGQVGGQFYAGNLKPGLYRVAVDESNLPIEYVPQQRSVIVEVQRNAVTPVSLQLNKVFAIAGQVRTAQGEAVPHAAVDVYNRSGERVGRVQTGLFGFYRVDNLPPAAYTVSYSPDSGSAEGAVRRAVAIEDDYLFGVDLVVVPAPEG
ncbi:carboxypeptidase regulatory-like domain-containing protein [Aestuariicella hydrocarbonica]|uniref:Carboxypeptidase regulatory-like domain-containing protein n=1 Tax=Pseudomaricurvus hydrocarbonicus TaxID=1470433 RepID=A0A9E5JQI3_9GAMM|nr:carboxypeptidase-like regulatory domain-containing protein [Aestuariicella hydrocarbonica]NHO64827.1 carboxypeptidase regulatory-like domain-containing protein [Aestuariicella hydrocarbonica]